MVIRLQSVERIIGRGVSEGVAKGESYRATFRGHSPPNLASSSSSAVVEFVEPSRTPSGGVVRQLMPVCHVTGLVDGTLLTTRCIVHTRYEAMLHLDVISCTQQRCVNLFPCGIAAALSLIACEDLDKHDRTVDRTVHSPQAARARKISLHARLAAKFTWVVTGILPAHAWRAWPCNGVGPKLVEGLHTVQQDFLTASALAAVATTAQSRSAKRELTSPAQWNWVLLP